jgi:hypothetical protein
MEDYFFNKSNELNKSLVDDLVEKTKVLLHYVTESGIKLPVESIKFDETHMEKPNIEIISLFNSLNEVIAPATIDTIEFTRPTVKLFWKWGSPTIPIMRSFMMMSLLFLAGFVITGYKDFLNDKIAEPINLFFSAGLGAYFYSLYTANKYVVNRTFDKKYITYYNNRVIIGIIAGFILSTVFVQNIPSNNSNLKFLNITPSIIAIVGGFSVDAVVKILNRIVAMLVALVQGETKDLIETISKESALKSEAKLLQERIKITSEINTVINSLKSLDDKDRIELQNLTKNIIKV